MDNKSLKNNSLNNTLSGDLSEAMSRMRAGMSLETLRRFEVLANVSSKHVTTDNDLMLSREIDALVGMAAWSFNGKRREGSALVVTGESGAGKTTLLDRLFRKRPEFHPYTDRFGVDTSPLISMVAPSPCTLKQLGRELLKAMGYPLARDLKEHMVWELVRQQLRLRKVMFVHIDEMQHAVTTANEIERQKVSDTLKNVMQQPDWPVWFILSGVNSLSKFVNRDVQLMRRCRIFEFENLSLETDFDAVIGLVDAMVIQLANLKLGVVLERQFVGRLLHASYGRFGVVIQLTKGAIEQALFDAESSAVVTLSHFASAYEKFSGCKEAENIFTHRDWEMLQPSNAFVRAPSGAEQAQQPAAKKSRKSRKGS